MQHTNPATYERLTGQFWLTLVGDVCAINLGNIEMVKTDYGMKEVEVYASARGISNLARRDFYQSKLHYTIDMNQFHTPVIPLLILGDQLADRVIGAATGSTFSFTAVLGRGIWIGVYGITTLTSVKVSTVTKTRDVDFFFDEFTGMIEIPVVAAGIAAGDTVVVTFSSPALTMEEYQGMTKFNRLAALVGHLEDEYGPPSKWIMKASVSVSAKGGADAADPNKFRKSQLDVAVLGKPIFNLRKT